MINFGDRLKTLRKNSGMTQMQVAEKTGLSQSNINTWERNRSLPLPDGLIALANCFDCSVDYLLGRESEDGTIVTSSGSPLTQDELRIMGLYRRLNRRQKEAAFNFLSGMLAV